MVTHCFALRKSLLLLRCFAAFAVWCSLCAGADTVGFQIPLHHDDRGLNTRQPLTYVVEAAAMGKDAV